MRVAAQVTYSRLIAQNRVAISGRCANRLTSRRRSRAPYYMHLSPSDLIMYSINKYTQIVEARYRCPLLG
jgi:hypothetical protein